MLDLMIASDRKPAGSQTVSSPYDGRELETIATGGMDHVADALTAAHDLYRDRSAWLSIPERIEILQKTADIMQSQVEELTVLAASEGGKPYQDSKVEVVRAINGVNLCIETLKMHSGNVIPLGRNVASSGRAAFTLKEPIGVVVAVSAFNHPLNLIVHQVCPAVAVGCPVIVKPAGDTPLSCLRLVSILREAGLPDAWCQVLIADNRDAATALVTDSRVAFLSFIGSSKVGWMLRSKLAPGARCALEHGGVAPLILAEPFNEDAALPAVLKGGFYHAGQVCVSVQRVYAPAAVAESFAKVLAGEANKLVVGAPEDPATEVGPLIRQAEVDRVEAWVGEAIAGGATLLSGGRRLSDTCYAPTVLLDPPADAKVSREEVFGPVVCVYSYDELDEAVAAANSLDVSFQAAVFCDNIDTAMHLYKNLDASAVMLNDHTAFRDDVMPFAGLKTSGHGVGGIPYTMEDMQIEKMLVIKSPAL